MCHQDSRDQDEPDKKGDDGIRAEKLEIFNCMLPVSKIVLQCTHMINSDRDTEMGKSTTITIRVDQEIKDRLEGQAEVQNRSKSFLANEAIVEYLDVQEWQVEGVKKAIKSLDAGKGIPHDDVMDWVSSWGSAKELPKPTV
ncbi:MAG: hypothetical protein GY751_17560 [Bacteroidetes bacterium]|nr:hypothetical protein [Bacteroidota bacterium]